MFARLWQRFRHNSRRWVLYFVIGLAGLVLEMGGEIFGSDGGVHRGSLAVFYSMLYQRFATAAYRKPDRQFVRLVTISPTSEPQEIFGDVCEKRDFEAGVIKQVRKLRPAAVVMDFWYGPKWCREGDDRAKSKRLEDAIAEASREFPVVIGLGSHTRGEFEAEADPELAQLVRAGFSHKDLIVDERVEFAGEDIVYGLARINADTRRVPISWNVFATKREVTGERKRIPVFSLAYTAAAQHKPDLQAKLNRIIQRDEHPFTSFMREEDFVPVHAIDLVCGGRLNSDTDWKKCAQPEDPLHDSRFRNLSGGQIILIGENSQRDRFESVIGEVPGYLLQANYIEGLLDNRLFRPLPLWCEIALTLLGFAIVIACFEVVPRSAYGLIGLLAGYVAVALMALVCNLVGIYLGWFAGFWLSLVPVPLVEFIFTAKMHSLPDEKEESETSRGVGA